MSRKSPTQLRITPLNRPVDNHDWMHTHTPLTPEQQAESDAYHKQREALRRQFESEWVPPPGYSSERDDEEMTCIESAAFDVWEERRAGRIAAASTPVWVDAFDYWLIDGPSMEDNGILAKQPTATSLTLPIVLQGGGDMQITFETRKYVDKHTEDIYGPGPRTNTEHKYRLVVRTEHGVFTGQLKRRVRRTELVRRLAAAHVGVFGFVDMGGDKVITDAARRRRQSCRDAGCGQRTEPGRRLSRHHAGLRSLLDLRAAVDRHRLENTRHRPGLRRQAGRSRTPQRSPTRSSPNAGLSLPRLRGNKHDRAGRMPVNRGDRSYDT